MSTPVLAVIHTKENNHIEFREAISFLFHKDKYSANTELNIVLQDKKGTVPEYCTINRIELTVGGVNLHQGLIDSAEVRRENGVTQLRIRSRGFTCLLLANEMEPGIHTDISIGALMTDYYHFPPFVKWKIDHNILNYIYVKPHRSMWDSIINLSYKLYGEYPYIRYANEINLYPHNNYRDVVFMKDDYLASGWITRTKGMLSHLHMQDIQGNYGAFEREWDQADEMYIVRHKQVAFDNQYLDNPERSMDLLLSTASQKWRTRYIEIPGYIPLDINDYMSAESLFAGVRVCGVTVSGDRTGVKTRFEVYYDSF